MFSPPRTTPLPAIPALLRAAWRRDPNLLGLLPAEAYRMEVGFLGYSRRSMLIVNEPSLARHVLTDPDEVFPKSDLMAGALEPLIGDSIFVSSGATWRRQRAMIDPSLTHMRVGRAFSGMEAAIADAEARLDESAASGAPFSLDLAMSHLTADVICRTVFSTSLASKTARDVFDDFTLFERKVAQVGIGRMIFDPPFKQVAQPPDVAAACVRIRRHLGDLVDPHCAPGAQFDDIAADVVAARDPSTGEGFSREELIDQLGVFFLAGHETSASALTWAFYLLAVSPETAARLRDETDAETQSGAIDYEATKRLAFARNVFRETLRLYPPITFLPRVAIKRTRIGPRTVRRGAMVMIAPWVLHRHEKYWRNPHVFDPDRFAPEREGELTPGAYIPFGVGPRVCAGAAFAMTEAVLIMARLIRRYEFEVIEPDAVRPVARLTTRPADEILCRVRRRG